MTINEAKKDLRQRLEAHDITYTRLTGKTVDFIDLGRAARIFLTVWGAGWPGSALDDARPKPRPYHIVWRHAP